MSDGVTRTRSRVVRPAAVLLPGFVGTELPDWLARRLRDGLAGVCLFGPNISSTRQLRALTDSIVDCNPHALIAIDEEGGDVTRLYYDRGAPTPGNAWLGRRDELALTERSAYGIGLDLRAVGVNLDFAPSVDVNSDDTNPVIGVRSFGADPRHVAGHASAWVHGLQAAGVAACAKHFPGHGDTRVDSHVGLPVLELDLDDLRGRELVPFEAAIEAGVRTVMTSHILLPRIDAAGPATFSSRLLVDVLRGDLGFTGVVVSDALDMAGASAGSGVPAAAVRALAGGCDLLCLGTDTGDDELAAIEAALLSAADADETLARRLVDSAARVAALGEDVAAMRIDAYVDAHEPAEARGRVDVRDVVSAFDLGERAREILARVEGPWAFVVLESAPNNAAGVVPWGVAAARGAEDPEVIAVDETSRPDALDGLRPDRPIAVVGQDIHRHGWARRVVDRLRSGRRDVLVVEMGWPAVDRSYADVVTYGGSRLIGEALLDLLASRREVDR